jgi:Zn-dependent protease
MKWSWRIGSLAGIDVFIHATFVLPIGWVLVSHWLVARSVWIALQGALFVLSLFGCVLLHELGHALAARAYGIKTRDITLLPIGGVARLERMPERPLQELWVALAGPLVNVAIAAALFVYFAVSSTFVPVQELGVTQGSMLARLMVVNAFLAVFNLLPAFPMDGGRVLRALLAARIDYTRATQIAAHVGQGMALFFGFLGFFGNPMLLFIAFFVWIGAAQEAGMVQMKTALGGIPVSRAMITDFKTLAPSDPLAEAVRLIIAGSQHDFPVVEQGRVAGVLARGDLVKALAEKGNAAPVREAMRTGVAVVDAGEMLERAFLRLQDCECHTIPVTRNGELVGLVTSENLGELLMIQEAIRSRGQTASPPPLPRQTVS